MAERPAARLNQATDFAKLKRFGKRRQGERLLVVHFSSARPQGTRVRLAVQTARWVGKATVRNVWRRRIKEIFRRQLMPKLLLGEEKRANDFLVIVRAQGQAPPQKELAQELKQLITI